MTIARALVDHVRHMVIEAGIAQKAARAVNAARGNGRAAARASEVGGAYRQGIVGRRLASQLCLGGGGLAHCAGREMILFSSAAFLNNALDIVPATVSTRCALNNVTADFACSARDTSASSPSLRHFLGCLGIIIGRGSLLEVPIRDGLGRCGCRRRWGGGSF